MQTAAFATFFAHWHFFPHAHLLLPASLAHWQFFPHLHAPSAHLHLSPQAHLPLAWPEAHWQFSPHLHAWSEQPHLSPQAHLLLSPDLQPHFSPQAHLLASVAAANVANKSLAKFGTGQTKKSAASVSLANPSGQVPLGHGKVSSYTAGGGSQSASKAQGVVNNSASEKSREYSSVASAWNGEDSFSSATAAETISNIAALIIQHFMVKFLLTSLKIRPRRLCRENGQQNRRAELGVGRVPRPAERHNSAFRHQRWRCRQSRNVKPRTPIIPSA